MPIYLKCIPKQFTLSIYDIDYQDLKQQGITALFFDLDNTIIGYDEPLITQGAQTFLEQLSQNFSVVVISNSERHRVVKACQETQLTHIWSAKKPLKFGFKKALSLTGTKPNEVAVIGDQLMTDVLGANRIGAYAILVKAVKIKSDRWMTRMNRKVEKFMLRKIEKKQPKLFAERLKSYVDSK